MSKYVRISFAVVLLAAVALPLVAGGQPEVPSISFRKAPTYISPGSQDNGVLTLEIATEDVQNLASIKNFVLNIYDTEGNVVFSQTATVTDPRTFFARALGTQPAPTIAIPESIRWDGTNQETGTQVDDDVYFYQLTVTNTAGLGNSSSPLQVVVDTVAPQVLELTPSALIFSPNGDGVRETITFTQRTDAAYTWTYSISNSSGTTVWTAAPTQAPESATAADLIAVNTVTWDGKGNQGSTALQADGRYTYTIAGVDRAGNRVSQTQEFQLNTDEASLRVHIGDANPAYSPAVAGDLPLFIDLSDTNGLTRWTVEVKNSQGIVARRYSGTSAPPAQVLFRGKGNPGRPENEDLDLPDGEYTVELSALYANGTNPISEPLDIQLDRAAPSSGITLATLPTATQVGAPVVFGGERKPRIQISTVNLEEDQDYSLIVEHDSGLSLSLGLEELAEFGIRFPYTWDGTVPAALAAQFGATVPAGTERVPVQDGVYQFVLRAVDAAGNVGTSNAARFAKDTADRSTIAINLSQTALSPGGDQGYEVVRIEPEVPSEEWIEYTVLSILNSEGTPFFIRTSREPIDYHEWAGTRTNGVSAPDGAYTVELNIQYYNGDNPVVRSSEQIILSRSRPNVTADVPYRVFTPDGDGDRDTLPITQSSSQAQEWVGTFFNSENQAVRTITWTGQATDFEWDGTDSSGAILPDGYYRYEVAATNQVGNTGSASLINLKIDNLSATIAISADLEVFSPNNDGFRDVVTLVPTVAQVDLLRAWEVELVNETGRIRRLIQGGRTLPTTIPWDGQNDAGTVEDGNYTATIRVEYTNGNSTERTSETQIILVKTPPVGRVTVSPERFSPDGDGTDDTLTISLDASASDRPVDRWRVEILDPVGNLFRSWEGTGVPPATLNWDGRSSSGELVQSAVDYIVQFRVEDNLRNFHVSGDVASVDVLVIPDGNRLRILIPSIVFAPNTPDLFEVEGEQLARNLDTLRRLASILNRYADYRILVEGHATQIYWNDPVRGPTEQSQVLVPLSRSRATEVRQALTILGVDWSRMSVAGIGGARPVVPHGDEANRWKNRRVEFILERR